MKNIRIALAALLLVLPVAAPILSGSSAVAAPASQSSAKAKGASTKPANAPKVPNLKTAAVKPAPPSKGGPKTKDAYFTTHIDNRSGRYVNVWIDGDYQGVVGPYGDLYVTTISGSTRIYAEDANGNYWNHTFYKTYGTYKYTLLR